MHVVIFEDSHWSALAPFSLSRPVFAMATGLMTLLQKQIRHLKPTRLTLWVRPEFESYCRQRIAPETGVPTLVNVALDHEPALLINGRSYFSQDVEKPSQDAVAEREGRIMAARINQPGLAAPNAVGSSDRWNDILKLPAMPWNVKSIESPVDLIYANEQSIIEDFARLETPSFPTPAGPYHLVNRMDIWLGQEVNLSAGCVIDASRGPVIIAEGAAIGPNAVVQGPCYIGPGSTISPLGQIRAGTTIGAQCKVGGEVSASIILNCSNKAHDGFVGHSYVGEWVNLGAGTTTSNLKNTYGEISIKRGSAEIYTGRRFLGSLIGDHSKTAILTRLMTGSYVGFCSMLAGSNHSPGFVPSYTFWTDKGREAYQLEKAIEVAQRVYTRRARAWSEADEQIMNYVAAAAPAIET